MHRQSNYSVFIAELKGVLKKLEDDHLPGVIVLAGANEYLHMKTFEALTGAWRARFGFAPRTIGEEELAPERLLGLWEQGSFLEPRNLYFVRRVTQLKDLPKKLTILPVRQRSTTSIAFSLLSKDLGSGLQKEVHRLGAAVIPCHALAPWEIRDFVIGLASKKGVTLTVSAAETLVGMCGDDLFKIENELTKLGLIFAESKNALGPEDIRNSCVNIREDHVFALDNLLLERKFPQASLFVQELIERGESAIAVLGLFARHCRNAIKISSARGRGLNPTVTLPPFVVKRYNQYVNAGDKGRFARALALCAQADMDFKSSKLVPPDFVFSELLTILATSR